MSDKIYMKERVFSFARKTTLFLLNGMIIARCIVYFFDTERDAVHAEYYERIPGSSLVFSFASSQTLSFLLKSLIPAYFSNAFFWCTD